MPELEALLGLDAGAVLALGAPWALALLPLPLLVRWLLPPWREPSPALRVPFFERTAQAAGRAPEPGALERTPGRVQLAVGLLCWSLLVLAVARPERLEPPIERTQSARDLMLAVDLSQSMEAKDFTGASGEPEDRLAAVKGVVTEFVARRKDDRIGLVAFGTSAFPQAPLTLDHASIASLLDELAIGVAGPQTAIGDAIGVALKMTERSQAKDKVLILLTDGNDTASRVPPARAAELARDRKLAVHTIGIGDPNATGEQRVDFAALEKISATTGGKSYRGQDRAGLEAIYGELDRLTPALVERTSYRPKRELYWLPLGAGAVLFALYHVLAWAGAAARSVHAGRSPEPAAAEGRA